MLIPFGNLRRLSIDLVRRLFFLSKRIPFKFQIEVTNECNFTCKICPREYLNLDSGYIEIELYNKILKQIPPKSVIILTGWGEPLLHPNIATMVTIASRAGHWTSLTTNGLALNPVLAEKLILAGINNITFSIDSITKEDNTGHPAKRTVLQNLQWIYKYKLANSRSFPAISVQTTLRDGHEKDIIDVIRYFGKQKEVVERIHVMRLNAKNNKLVNRPSWEKERCVLRNAEDVAAEYNIRLDSNFSYFDGIAQSAYKILRPMMYRFDKFCLKNFDSCYININGDVTPCCELPKKSFGNVKNDNVVSIWRSEPYQSFRNGFPSDCTNCDGIKLRMLQ
jgi:MoaA/NifB/PqqE/SkfB family radical SAM enzyme